MADHLPALEPQLASEADPAALARRTDGRALVATGSPYPPLAVGGTTLPVAHCNNVCTFPAVGLGAIASGATRVTDGMTLAATNALGAMPPAVKARPTALLSPIGELRRTDEALAERVRAAPWQPAYPREA